MGVILKNNAVSTITTAISASDVGLAVAAGTGTLFPTLGASDYFYATLVSAGGTYEVIKVTARVGDTMTIVRAQEGTTAQSFASGSRIEVRVTAASVRDTATDIVLSRLGSTATGEGASLVGIHDVGNYYAATTVEGVLQELGASGGTVGINAIVDNFTGNGSTVNFTLSKAPVSQNTIDVFINGVYQNKTDFSFAGTTLTFTQAPPLGSEIEVCINTNALAGTVMASNVSYNQGGAGAVAQTVQTKLEQVVSVMDFGVVADDTDQTTEILAAFSSLGANWEGVILIPGNIRFDFNQVIPAVPSKAIVQFTNTCQIGAGYRQQFTGVISNPPDANTDTAFSVIDPHYPDLMLNNPRTSGTVSGDAGLSGFSWAQGFFQNGSKGPRFQWQANFRRSVVRTAEYGGAGVACFELRTRFPERAINYEDWFNGISVQTNDYILSTNGAFYKALSTGTSTVAPTFTSGSQTVGGVTWQWEDGSFVNFRIPFYVDELGRVGNQAVPSGHTQLWQQNPEDPENFNVFYEASGATKSIRFHFRPTDGGSTRATEAVFDFTESQGFRLLNGNESKIFFAANDVGGLSLGQYGLRTVQPSDGDTTPSVASAGQLRINNTAPTSITDFIDATENQEVSLFFTNSNTTLVHSSALVLKGGINVTPATNQIITIVREPSANAYWVEKSRNF